MLTQERLRQVLDYNPEAGAFRWRVRPERVGSERTDRSWNTRFAGKVAGCRDPGGYTLISVDGRLYGAHRLAWLYVHGQFPPGDIDHRDRVKGDNRIGRLRPATRSQNNANSVLRKDNRSGLKGVSWHSGAGRWIAQIAYKGDHFYLGLFDDPRLAHAVRNWAAEMLHGEFARAA